jgi:radical SAM protein with 4Fe4S-binding SPASM domain
MFCHVSQRKFSEFSDAMYTAVTRQRIPFMGALELTYRCNQACAHCYCNLGLHDTRKDDELSTAEIIRILDEIAAAGCLWLLLTGGEVLVRKDFPDIYVHALKAGMLVEVFTNATLIDDATAELFSGLPPFGIDISIYGSTPALHDRITRAEGSFARTMEGVACLKRHGIGFSLKTVLMAPNYADLNNMQRLAESLGSRFHFDSLVSPRTDGGMSPAQYRLDIDRMVGLELDADIDYKACEYLFANFWKRQLREALNCGSGVFAFNINPYGALSPCTMFSSFQYPLKARSFRDAWQKMVAEYGLKQNSFIPDECSTCSMLLLCPRCAAWAETETGSVNRKVDYLCDYAKCLERKFFKKKEVVYEEETV